MQKLFKKLSTILVTTFVVLATLNVVEVKALDPAKSVAFVEPMSEYIYDNVYAKVDSGFDVGIPSHEKLTKGITYTVDDNNLVKVSGYVPYSVYSGFDGAPGSKNNTGHYIGFQIPVEGSVTSEEVVADIISVTGSDNVEKKYSSVVLDKGSDEQWYFSLLLKVKEVGGALTLKVDWDGAGTVYALTTYTFDFSGLHYSGVVEPLSTDIYDQYVALPRYNKGIPSYEKLTDEITYSVENDTDGFVVKVGGNVPYSEYPGFDGTMGSENNTGHYISFQIPVPDGCTTSGDFSEINNIITKLFGDGESKELSSKVLDKDSSNKWFYTIILRVKKDAIHPFKLNIDWDGEAGQGFERTLYTFDFTGLNYGAMVQPMSENIYDQYGSEYGTKPSYEKLIGDITYSVETNLDKTGTIFAKGFVPYLYYPGFDDLGNGNFIAFQIPAQGDVTNTSSAVANIITRTSSNGDSRELSSTALDLDNGSGESVYSIILRVNTPHKDGETKVPFTLAIDWDGDAGKVYERTTYTFDASGLTYGKNAVEVVKPQVKIIPINNVETFEIVFSEKLTGTPVVTFENATIDGSAAILDSKLSFGITSGSINDTEVKITEIKGLKDAKGNDFVLETPLTIARTVAAADTTGEESKGTIGDITGEVAKPTPVLDTEKVKYKDPSSGAPVIKGPADKIVLISDEMTTSASEAALTNVTVAENSAVSGVDLKLQIAPNGGGANTSVNPTTQIQVVLNYPIGETFAMGKTYKLYHIVSGTAIELPITPTAKGLVFETDSFSPFILVSTPKVPQVPGDPNYDYDKDHSKPNSPTTPTTPVKPVEPVKPETPVIDLSAYTNDLLNVYENSRVGGLEIVNNIINIKGYAFVKDSNFNKNNSLYREIIFVNETDTSVDNAYRKQVTSVYNTFLTNNVILNPNKTYDYSYANYKASINPNKIFAYKDNKTETAMAKGSYLVYVRISDGVNGKLFPLKDITLGDGTNLVLPQGFELIDTTTRALRYVVK